jgi:hypothetical protein
LTGKRGILDGKETVRPIKYLSWRPKPMRPCTDLDSELVDLTGISLPDLRSMGNDALLSAVHRAVASLPRDDAAGMQSQTDAILPRS